MQFRILIAYHHQIVLPALTILLQRQGYDVVGLAPEANDAVRLAAELQPDVALLDLDMPSGNRFECVLRVLEVSPLTEIVLLAEHRDNYSVLEAVRAGVKGYVLKTKPPEELLRTLSEVARGGAYFSPEFTKVLVQGYRSNQDPADRLTGREQQVVRLIADGHSTKQVAGLLGISVKTADSHRTRIMDKLQIHETATLVRYAVREGLVAP